MNEFLAQIYGTSDALEKTAQSVLLSKLAEDEGIDLSGLSPDQLEEIAQSVLTESSDEGAEGEDLSKEAQANIAEADFLGRVMAHSMTQELDLIKQAGVMDKLRGAGGKIKEVAGKGYQGAKKGLSAAKDGVKRYGKLMRGGDTIRNSDTGKMIRPGNHKSAFQDKHGRWARSEARKSLGARVGTGAALAGGGAAAYKMSKEASAFETLATQRALQMLQEQGYDVDGMQAQQYQQPQAAQQLRPTQQLAPQQGLGVQNYGYGVQDQYNQGGYEKLADPMDQFWGSVDDRAYEMLGEAGYLEDSE